MRLVVHRATVRMRAIVPSASAYRPAITEAVDVIIGLNYNCIRMVDIGIIKNKMCKMNECN